MPTRLAAWLSSFLFAITALLWAMQIARGQRMYFAHGYEHIWFEHGVIGIDLHAGTIRIPFVLPLAIFAALPAYRLLRRRSDARYVYSLIRAKRFFFNALVLTSLFLCFIAIVLWITDRRGKMTWHEFTLEHERNWPGWFNLIAQSFVDLVPNWCCVATTAVLPAFWLLSRLLNHLDHQNERALNAGLCPACGYDLRATPNRCPECGHATDEFGSPIAQ